MLVVVLFSVGDFTHKGWYIRCVAEAQELDVPKADVLSSENSRIPTPTIVPIPIALFATRPHFLH